MSLTLGLMLLQGVTEAASRLMITMEQSASLVIDGVVHPPAIPGQRVTINHIAPGNHVVKVQDLTGVVLYEGNLEIPDGVSVTARWSTAGGLSYEGPSAATLPPPVHTPPSSNPYADIGSGSVTVSGSIPGVPSSGSSDEGDMAAAGGTDGVSTNSRVAQTTGQIAQNIASNAVPGGNIIVGTGLGGAAVDALRRSPAGASLGSATPSKQIIKPDPEAILGDVILYHRGVATLDIYVDGMYRGQLGGGELDRTMRIEIGQRQVEFWTGGEARFRGELQVDQNVPVQLELSDTALPRSPNRSWAWADQY